MYQTLKQKPVNRFTKNIPQGITPQKISWYQGTHPAMIIFSDGNVSQGSCVRCTNPPCIEYSPDELTLPLFRDFPADQNNEVCATSAITWPRGSPAPTIDVSLCIKCGLCVGRCPVKAIYFDSEGAYLNDEPNRYFMDQKILADQAITDAYLKTFNSVPETGSYLVEDDEVIINFRHKFEDVAKKQSAQFPNHLARNLLIQNGIGTAMRRRGDINIRMDLVLGPPGVNQGTSEVELGAAILDAPRNILDNIAVLVARYKLSKGSVVPLIVSLDLPNLRSEYWQFIKDVRNILGVKINSVTIGALVLMTWNRAKLTIVTGEELYVDVDFPSLRPHMEVILGRKLGIKGEGYPGFLESSK